MRGSKASRCYRWRVWHAAWCWRKPGIESHALALLGVPPTLTTDAVEDVVRVFGAVRVALMLTLTQGVVMTLHFNEARAARDAFAALHETLHVRYAATCDSFVQCAQPQGVRMVIQNRALAAIEEYKQEHARVVSFAVGECMRA
jgi:hypothetical protein